ncbi:MAG: diaminopimelate decarboxylase [Paramuribaculum sp.]|nr:diaminopimelate decarboxylase [Paramuribaculum sp.]
MQNINHLTTPCFIFDEAEFERGITGFRDALKSYFNKSKIGYSVKTNSLPYALQQAHRYGCKAEVVSHDEYRLARLCGYEPQDIIYNGPMKSRETFIEAVTCGAIVNIETKRELQWLSQLSEGRVYNIGLRLNINISHISPEDADGDDDNSRFGFSDESGEFAEAIDYINSSLKLRLAGLHIHRTAHSRSPRFYERSVESAAKVIEKYGLKLDYLDVGGGYFGIFPNKPTFSDYAEAFYKSLHLYGLEQLEIIVEPGNALTASGFKFLSEVIDVKRVNSKTRFITTDGSRNDIDPFFKKTDYLKEILISDNNRPIEPLQIVTGCTCLEYDRLFTLKDSPRLEVGDQILYNNVGAYTMTLSPQFIRLWPRVYTIDLHGNYHLIRRESRAADIMNLNI